MSKCFSLHYFNINDNLDPRLSDSDLDADDNQLRESAENGDFESVKRLIRRGANIDNYDYDGRSPLHLAACGE